MAIFAALTLFCHSVATFLTSVSSYEGGCGFEDIMANSKERKAGKPKKEKKRKPIYEIEGFVLTIPQDVIDNMLRDMSKPIPKK